MSRILFAVWPLVGHINPFMSVAKALQERGHSVAFYTSGKERSRLEDEGITVFPFEHVEEEPIWEVIRAVEAEPTRGRLSPGPMMRACRNWLAGTVRDQVADIRSVCESWQPDLIVSDTPMWGPIALHPRGPARGRPAGARGAGLPRERPAGRRRPRREPRPRPGPPTCLRPWRPRGRGRRHHQSP